jgi:hypothetical protein
VKLTQFIRSLFSFLFFFHGIALSWNISSECLAEKLQIEPPLWMRQRIESDLSSFQEGLPLTEVALCLQELKKMQGVEVAGLVRIRFVNAKTTCEPLFSLNSEQIAALREFLSALHLLHSVSPLPDFDLILSVCPSFDRPLLLMKTSVPIFAVSKERKNRKVVLIPRLWNSDRETLLHPPSYDWGQKIEKALWRGFATDGPYRFYEWDFKPRARLALRSVQHPDLIDAALVPSPALDDYMAQWLENLSLLSAFKPPGEQCSYKYLLSLDGKAAPSSFEWQLFSQSLIFKTESNQIEWFYEALIPGVHYVPFLPNGNDLIEKILWAKSHDDEARAIAENGSLFAADHLLDEEVFVYLYHVLRAYSYWVFKN